MNVDTRSVAHVATQPLDSAADAYALDEDETQPLDDAGYVPYEDETQPLDSAGYP